MDGDLEARRHGGTETGSDTLRYFGFSIFEVFVRSSEPCENYPSYLEIIPPMSNVECLKTPLQIVILLSVIEHSDSGRLSGPGNLINICMR